MKKNEFMGLALELAKKSELRGEIPVGAVIVKDGVVVSYAHNEVYCRNDPTAHAEIVAIRKASKILNASNLTQCDIYVTLEPCPMCAHAISIARLRRLYFSAYDSKGGGVENGPRVYDSASCHHMPEVYGGIRERESSILLKEFFSMVRKRTLR